MAAWRSVSHHSGRRRNGPGVGFEDELKAMEKEVEAGVEAAVEFANASPKPEESQLLENVFSDPKGFGIGEDGKYLYERM